MNTQASSVIITLFIWYLFIGVYNLAFLAITKKITSLDWKNFILETLGLTALYFAINALSVQLVGGSTAVFFAANTALILGSVLLYSKYVMKLEMKEMAIYSIVFAAIFNVYWYSLIGII